MFGGAVEELVESAGIKKVFERGAGEHAARSRLKEPIVNSGHPAIPFLP